MSWARFDDEMLDNPKIVAAGPIGFALHAAAILHCSRNLTDGFVPYPVARRLLATTWTEDGPEDRIQVWSLAMVSGMVGDDGAPVIEHVIELLCDLDLWEVVPHGYEVHDYLVYNPTREKVLADREAGRKRAADSYSRQRSSGEETPKKDRSFAHSSPDPVPVPLTNDSSLRSESRSSRKSIDEVVIAEVAAFTEAWNANCDPLPKLRKPPAGRDPIRLALQAWRYFDGDAEVLARAVQRCALDTHYREGKYGFQAFARHLDRWGAEPQAPPRIAEGAPILHLSADERAKRRRAVNDAVQERLRSGVMPTPSDFAPEDRGYLIESLAENSWLVEQLKSAEMQA